MPVVRRCEYEGCGILTLGRYCVIHEAPAPRREFPRGRPYPPPTEEPPAPARIVRGEPRFEEWLGACGGFQVFDVSGRLGVVESIARGPDGVVAVRVRQGLFQRSLIVVLAEHVESISPRQRSLVVRRPRRAPVPRPAPARRSRARA